MPFLIHYFTHRNVNSQFKNNLCEKAKTDMRTPNSRQGGIFIYNRNSRFHTRDGLFREIGYPFDHSRQIGNTS